MNWIQNLPQDVANNPSKQLVNLSGDNSALNVSVGSDTTIVVRQVNYIFSIQKKLSKKMVMADNLFLFFECLDCKYSWHTKFCKHFFINHWLSSFIIFLLNLTWLSNKLIQWELYIGFEVISDIYFNISFFWWFYAIFLVHKIIITNIQPKTKYLIKTNF